MTQTYVHGITDTVTHDVTSGAHRRPARSRRPGARHLDRHPRPLVPGDGAVVISRDGRAL